MEAPPRGGGADMEGVRPGTSGSVCVSRDVSLSTLVLPHASSSSPRESSPGLGSTSSHCPTVARQSMVPRYNIPPRRTSSGAQRQGGPSVTSRGLDISPPTRTMETGGLASEGA